MKCKPPVRDPETQAIIDEIRKDREENPPPFSPVLEPLVGLPFAIVDTVRVLTGHCEPAEQVERPLDTPPIPDSAELKR